MESRMAAQDMTFEQSSNEDNKNIFTTHMLYLQDKDTIISDEEEWIEHTTNQLKTALNTLDKRSQHIIQARWLNINNKSTLQELAKKYGVSAERVRQLEKNAMKKMKLIMQN